MPYVDFRAVSREKQNTTCHVDQKEQRMILRRKSQELLATGFRFSHAEPLFVSLSYWQNVKDA